MTNAVELRTLLCARDLAFAPPHLRTVAELSADPVQLVVHDDGSLGPAETEALGLAWPGVRVLPRAEADARMAEALRQHPACSRFRASTVWGLKLLDVGCLAAGDVFYVDGDVRCFRPYQGLWTGATAAGGPVFFHDHHWQAYSLRPWHLWRPGLALAASINTGLTIMAARDFDLDFLEWFLGRHAYPTVPAWIEPTAWAALAWRARGRTLDPAQWPQLYPDRAVGPETVGAHFLSAYRPRFARDLAREPDRAAPPVEVRLLPVARCWSWTLGRSQWRRWRENRAAVASRHRGAP